MSVEFDNDEHHKSILYAKLLQPTDESPSLINWLKKSGVVQTDEGANKILIGVMIFSLVLTGWVGFQSFTGDKQKSSPEADRLFQEQLENIHKYRR